MMNFLFGIIQYPVNGSLSPEKSEMLTVKIIINTIFFINSSKVKEISVIKKFY